MGTKVTKRLKSRVAVWRWTNWMRVRSRAVCIRDCFCAAKCWTSLDRSADTTSSGPGSPGVQPDWERQKNPELCRSHKEAVRGNWWVDNQDEHENDDSPECWEEYYDSSSVYVSILLFDV